MQLLFWFPYISVGFIPSQPQLAWEKGFGKKALLLL
jgi:hypothetical protein